MRLGKKIFGLFAGIMCLGALASCGSGSSDTSGSNQTIDAIENVYVKKGSRIADEKSEYEELKYEDLDSYKKLSSGIYITFKPKYDIYIHSFSINMEGSSDNISNYSCGTSKKLTYSYTNDTESDFSDVINVSNDNKIIIEKEYSSENYFYIYLDDYCEYSNIKFNYSKEKTTTDKEFDYYATLNGSNIELNELENELGKTKNISQLNMIININKDIKINKISLSLIIEAIRANYSGFSSYLTPQSNATPVKTITEDNADKWYPIYQSKNGYNLNYTIDSKINFSCFLTNVRSTSKGSIESLEYLNTYTEKSFTDTKFNYENKIDYTIDFNQNAKAGDYLVLSFNFEMTMDTSFEYYFGLGTTLKDEYKLYFTMNEYNISNFKIDYEKL